MKNKWFLVTFEYVVRILNYILILVFSTGAMIPHSDFSQLLKVSELMEHYKLHQEEDLLSGHESSFFEFFIEHIINEPMHTHDDTSHDDLPFQQFSMSVVLFIEEMPDLNSLNADNHFPKSMFNAVRNLVCNGYIVGVFQPPID